MIQINQYNIIIDSFINGQMKQCYEQFKELPVNDRIDFINTLHLLRAQINSDIIKYLFRKTLEEKKL